MQKFYQSLISLKHGSSALWNGSAGAPMVFVETTAPQNVLAFTREKEKNQVLAVFNLSPNPVEVNVQLPESGDYQDYFSGETKTLEKGSTIKLDKWGYQVFVHK
jgi:glycosidase